MPDRVLYMTDVDLGRTLPPILDSIEPGTQIVINRDGKTSVTLRATSDQRPEPPLRRPADVIVYCEFTKPSVAFQTNTTSPVHRISDLMFVSLLSLYMLGFLGLAISHVAALPSRLSLKTGLLPTPLALLSEDSWKSVFDYILIPLAPALFILITYAYVTGAIYVIYQATILTRASLELKGLRYDFLLSLLCAILFGCSILYPFAFPMFLSILCGFAIWRQGHEYKNFVVNVFELFHSRPSTIIDLDSQNFKQFSEDFTVRLRTGDYHRLRGWSVSSTRFLITVASLPLIPIFPATALFIWYPQAPQATWDIITALVSLGICLGAIRHAHRILGSRASLLHKREMNVMDQQYRSLILTTFHTCKPKHDQ